MPSCPPIVAALLATCVLASAGPAAQERGVDISADYQAAAEAGDHAALVALWRAHPHLVLVTIDADLEGSLGLREQSAVPDEAAIAALHARALFGARAATEATGHPIFLDYATAFTSWDEAQRRQFREGQAAYRRSHLAAKADDAEAAAQAARQCLQAAGPLGDWWGTAMGHSALGKAQLMAGDAEGALVSFSHARMIHHDLGLNGAEYGNLHSIAQAAAALGATERCRRALDEAIALGTALGDADGVRTLEAQREALGGAAAEVR